MQRKFLGTPEEFVKAIKSLKQKGTLEEQSEKLVRYKTIDGGNNWTLVNKNNSTSGLEYFISENLGYYSDGQIIYTTINGGKSWMQDYSIGTDYQNGDITNWTFVKTGQGFATTKDHRIIKKN